MERNQKGFGVVVMLLILAVAILVGVVGWYVLREDTHHNSADQSSAPTEPSNNTPRKNKEIEIEAARTKDLSKCEEIKGESYYFGPTDEQIAIPESEAKQRCRENIEKGITPALTGG